MDKLFEMINQEFKAQRTKYQVLPNFAICRRELRVLKVTSICACVRSFCFVSGVRKLSMIKMSYEIFSYRRLR